MMQKMVRRILSTQRIYAILAQGEPLHQRWNRFQKCQQFSATRVPCLGEIQPPSVSSASVLSPKLRLVFRVAESVLQSDGKSKVQLANLSEWIMARSLCPSLFGYWYTSLLRVAKLLWSCADVLAKVFGKVTLIVEATL